MRIRRFAVVVAGLSLVAGAAVAGQATAEVQGKPEPVHGRALAQGSAQAKAVSAACETDVGTITPDARNSPYGITATRPLDVHKYNSFKLFSGRASSSWYYWEPSASVYYWSGFVLQAGNLLAGAETYYNNSTTPKVSSKILGGGYGGFTTLTSANYWVPGTTQEHTFLYGLNTNGSLYRYRVNGPTGPVVGAGHAPGYKGFKAITVIATAPTYDTLLATTKAGALWTIHLPVTGTFKGTLKAVRASGFQKYDQLVAQRCGNATMLSAFDNTANTVTVYAMGKAVGSKTVMNTIGTAPATNDALVHFLYTGSGGPLLVGE
ncbi:hypothetical protein OHA70_22895 [Kribbella sp. NBC_00382]|uniref:hypothetical protein n=1 Tax=Kribbella sp. NBC_00382 TaxID=2975967 RepID=UPI002E21F0A9